jgi:glycosyltransferase involved in cell wall biosynthesis
MRVLVPFGTPYLYGMERAVIEIFDAIRPEVESHFIESKAIFDEGFPVIKEIERRRLHFSLFPDEGGWPRVGMPKSIWQLGKMVWALAKGNITVVRAIRSHDILYTPSLIGTYYCFLAGLYCRLARKRVVHHFHDLANSGKLLRFWSLFVTDFVHNTDFGYRAIVERHPEIRSKKNKVIPYIIDVKMNPCLLGQSPPPGTGPRNLFFVGQVSRHKGIDLLLEAFAIVAPRHPEAVLHLVGGCSEDFRQELNCFCEKSGLGDRVKHWGYRDDALRLLESGYLYVHTSPPSRFHESFGRSVMEAMSMGIPIVCFRSGALQEIVRHGETGLVCDESPESLAAALLRFLDDAGFRNTCGSQAKKRYEIYYSPTVIRPRWVSFFGEKEQNR